MTTPARRPAPRHCRPGRPAIPSWPPCAPPAPAATRPTRDIRILLAYARELATPRPYRLADLADATGKSISGVRTAYTGHDVRHRPAPPAGHQPRSRRRSAPEGRRP